MAWWQYILSMLAVMAAGTIFSITLPKLVRVTHLFLWKITPECWLKRQLFKVRATDPEFIGDDPWVTQYHVKSHVKSHDLAPPPEFIPREEFKAKTRDDRQ